MKTRWNGRSSFRYLLAAAPLAFALHANAQQTTRASVDSFGVEGDDDSGAPSLSHDGSRVAFHSDASNLATGDANSNVDVFVRLRATGGTMLASANPAGVPGNGPSREPAISADGRFVAFQSDATDLVLGDTNSAWDVFVRDLELGVTVRVSVDSAGQQVNGISTSPSISEDGRFIAFASTASTLVANDTNGQRDVFVHDRLTSATQRVSITSAGAQTIGGSSEAPAVSGDGRFVAFTSGAANLVASDTNNATDVFVHDRWTATTTRVSVASTGAQALLGSSAPVVALDGTAIAFQSNASNLVAPDTNNTTDVFLRNLVLNTTERISRSVGPLQTNGASTRPSISADGRRVLYSSNASNIVVPDANGTVGDVFVYDRTSGTTSLASLSFDNRQVPDGGEFGALAPGGSVAAFTSLSFKVVPWDGNQAVDVFVRDATPSIAPPASFCNADGSSTPCPCGNTNPSGTEGGCINSLGLAGTLLHSGSAMVSLDTFVLSGVNLPNSSALLLQGTTRQNGGLGTVLGDGLLCVSGAIVRLGVKPVVSNTVAFPEAGDLPLSVRGSVQPGDVKTYQLWYRNAAAFCSPETYNLTNAWEVTWAP